MRTSGIVAAFSALTSLVHAAPLMRRSSGGVAVYWGQEDGERSLADYCQSGQGIDSLILAFLYTFGNGQYPYGNFGDCTINSDGSFSDCSDLANDIQTCQDNGVKVFVSVGGGGSPGVISSENDATGLAYSLWYSYGAEQSGNSSPRPFGSVKVDGWDFDIESNPNNDFQNYLGDLINALRGYFSSDTSKSYYISGAPQCVIPDANMGNALMQAKFDYIWIQFYNNNCAAAEYTNSSGNNPDGNGKYNLNSWPGYLSGGASSGASLYVGLPASRAAAASFDWVEPQLLPKLVSDSTGVSGFGGIMMWNAAQSDKTTYNGCTYAQNCAKVLSSGNTC